jgi:prefoldin subunit 5
VEIRIGVQNAAREVVLESGDSAQAVEATVSAALEDGGVLSLKDEKGRTVLVPAAAIAFVEIAVEESRRVGFGTL